MLAKILCPHQKPTIEEEVFAEEKNEETDEPKESEKTEEDDILFADLMVEWLEMIANYEYAKSS